MSSKVASDTRWRAVGAVLQFWGYLVDREVRCFLQQILWGFAIFAYDYLVQSSFGVIHHVQAKFYSVGLLIRKCSILQLPGLGQNKACCFVTSCYNIGMSHVGQLAIHSPLRAARRVLTAWTLRVTGISKTGLRGGLMIVATPA